MDMRKFKIPEKYADYQYKTTPTELEEARWLVEQGDFKSIEEFLDFMRKCEISILIDEEAEKERKAKLRKKRREEAKKKKAA